MNFKNHKNSKIISVLILILLIFSILSSNSKGFTFENEDIISHEYFNYIIELVDTPVFTYLNNIKKEIGIYFPSIYEFFLKNKIINYRNLLINSHEKTINSILSLLNEKNHKNITISREYTGLFNGFFIENIPLNLVDKIKELPLIKNIYPNYKFSLFLDESIPLIRASDVWNLKNKYSENITGKDINIAILDTGIDYTHPDLLNNYIDGYDFVNNDNDPMDDHGHGTHCAGIIAGTGVNSNYEYIGVAPDVNLYAYKVLDSQGSGDLNNYIAGLEAAVDPDRDGDPSDHVDIISISFGTEKPGSPDDIFSFKADEIVDLGIVVVAAAGNYGPDTNSIASPGCSLKTITVGSIDKNGLISESSSRGPVVLNDSTFIKPDIVAPGVGIKSTFPGGGYVVMSGSSMACPHVAGVAALVLQVFPHLKPEEVKQIIRRFSVDLGVIGDDNFYGSGRIDVLNILNPPIAFLNISNSIKQDLIEIKGSALSSSSSDNDYIGYSLFYSNECSWIKIFESYKQINNDLLYKWDTSTLKSGNYKLKLEVASINISNIVIKELLLVNTSEIFVISFPKIINESSNFQIKITDINGTSVKAFVFFFSSFRIPRIKFGSTVSFISPHIYSSKYESIKGNIKIISLLKKEIVNKEIIILNNK